MNSEVNVLGTVYAIETRKWNDDRKLHEALGYVEQYSKKIILKDIFPDCMTVEDVDQLRREVARHEIVHAFFFESGMSEWAEDETLVEWVAVMLPKLAAAMCEAGAMPDADS